MAEKILKAFGLESWAELLLFAVGAVALFFLAQVRWEGLGEVFLAVINFMAD